jgi:hypothetical protein
MASVFDGMAQIFADTFGEGEGQVLYTPAVGSPKTINAIWWESTPGIAAFGGGDDAIAVDARRTELHVKAADIAAPKEGDRATRLSDGKVMEITAPIRPDGKGMIVCNLAEID